LRLEEKLNGFEVPPEGETEDLREEQLKYARQCRAKITRLEEEREKAKASLAAAKRCLYLAEQILESPFLPNVGVVYDRLTLMGRYAREALNQKERKRDWWYHIRIEGLHREAELAENGNF
jgi:hypothetical protein